MSPLIIFAALLAGFGAYLLAPACVDALLGAGRAFRVRRAIRGMGERSDGARGEQAQKPLDAQARLYVLLAQLLGTIAQQASRASGVQDMPRDSQGEGAAWLSRERANGGSAGDAGARDAGARRGARTANASADDLLLLASAGMDGLVEPGEHAALRQRLPIVAAALLGIAFLPLGALPALTGVCGGYLAGMRWPDGLLSRRAQRHGSACARGLASMLDILCMGIEAGLSFDAAFAIYVDRVDDELAGECRHALLEWQSGVISRADALSSMADRIGNPDVKRFVDMANQAIKLGAPLGPALADLAVEVRKRRRSNAEERIAKAPVKMLLPTGVLILPAMLIVVMGPVVLELVGELG